MRALIPERKKTEHGHVMARDGHRGSGRTVRRPRICRGFRKQTLELKRRYTEPSRHFSDDFPAHKRLTNMRDRFGQIASDFELGSKRVQIGFRGAALDPKIEKIASRRDPSINLFRPFFADKRVRV